MKNTKPCANNISIDNFCDDEFAPSKRLIKNWIKAALDFSAITEFDSIGVRIIDKNEMTELNEQYRQKQGPTNILSFAYALEPLSGDLAICASIVNEETERLSLEKTEHWAHIIVHGVLHLLGFDHQQDDEAKIMENMEMSILANLGIDSPYA